MEAKDFVELLAEFVTWGLVVVGWLIVNDQQEAREVAKSGYERINAVRDSFREIERQAISFHASAFNQESMQSLMRSIDRASREMTHLRKHGFIGLGTSEHAWQVRKAISGENFDPKSHKVLAAGSKILVEIEAACSALDRELLESAHNVTGSSRTLRQSLSAIFSWKMI